MAGAPDYRECCPAEKRNAKSTGDCVAQCQVCDGPQRQTYRHWIDREVGVTVPQTSVESNGASVLATPADLNYSPFPCSCSVCPICGMPPPR